MAPFLEAFVVISPCSLVGPVISKSIELLRELEKNKSLTNYYMLPASLGEFYLRVNDKLLARKYFQKAKSLISSKAGIDLLDKKISLCSDD